MQSYRYEVQVFAISQFKTNVLYLLREKDMLYDAITADDDDRTNKQTNNIKLDREF